MNAVQGRLAKLEATRGAAGAEPHTQDLIQMLNRLDLDAPGAVMPDAATYTAVCLAIAPRKTWPTHGEILDLLRRADELLAVELADWRRA